MKKQITANKKELAFEIIFLIFQLVKTLIIVLISRFFYFLLRKERIPSTVSELAKNHKFLSKVFKKNVIKVDIKYDKSEELKRKKKENIKEQINGVTSNHGTILVHFDDETQISCFLKLPPSVFLERLFFLAFHIYQNEINFFNHLKESKNNDLKKLFPIIYYAKSSCGDFLCILEDLTLPGNILMDSTFDKVIGEDHTKKYTKEKAKKVMKNYAKLHAIYWNSSPSFVFAHSSQTGEPNSVNRFLNQLFGVSMMNKALEKYPDIISDEVVDTFRLLTSNYVEIRKYWSSGPLTLIHGDSHLGNIYFTRNNNSRNYLNYFEKENNNKKNGDNINGNINTLGENGEEFEVAFYDMQIASKEKGMRDIVYHLLMSYPDSDLANDEEELIHYYLANLNEFIDRYHPGNSYEKFTFEQAFFDYRVASSWMIFICSFTVAKNLIIEEKQHEILTRLSKDVARLRPYEALQSVLKFS